MIERSPDLSEHGDVPEEDEGSRPMSPPRAGFDSGVYAPEERFDVVVETTAVMGQPSRPDATNHEFQWRMDAILLGETAFFANTGTNMRWHRTAAHVASDTLQHYLVSFAIDQGHHCDGEEFRPGDLWVWDLSTPREWVDLPGYTCVSFRVPRRLLGPKLQAPDSVGSQILSGDDPMARLAHDMVRSVWRQAERLSPADCELVVGNTVDLVAAAMNRSPELEEDGRRAVSWALAQKIRRYIERNLHDPALTPESIQRALRMSRAKLYRVFDVEGGVARYILQRRLERAYRVLLDPVRASQSITAIAYSLGFSSPSVFTRAFKRHFGMAPRDVRALRGEPDSHATPQKAGDRLWETWLTGI